METPPARAHSDGREDASRRGRTAPADSLRQQAARGHLLGFARGLERAPPGRRRIDRPSLDPLRRDGLRRRLREPSGACRREDERPYDVLIGTDGSASAVRAAILRTDRRTARRGAARPRVQGALDSAGRRRRRRIPDGEERPPYLAARRIHADRAPQRRRQLHGDAVSAESGRRELPGAHDSRGRSRALRTPVRRRDSAHAAPRRGLLRKSHRPSGDDPLRALVVRGSCARPRRCGARDRSLSRAGHERGVRRLRRLRSTAWKIRIVRGTRSSRNSNSAAGPIPTRSPTWPWRTTSRCGRPSGSRSSS